jgi:hypothetical protein
MIPSAQQLPYYSLVCIVRSIAQEATTAMPVKAVSTSSASLLPTLQQLIMPVMTIVGTRLSIVYSKPTTTR